MEQRRLRILYTINNAPTYTLAFSPSPVTVTVLPSFDKPVASSSQNPVEPSPSYATVDLKTCIESICASSPEFFLDASRDYSVYVLDPLESPTDRNSNDLIPMGLGFLSNIRTPLESRNITGTLTKLRTGETVVEVYFSLSPVSREASSASSGSKSSGKQKATARSSEATRTQGNTSSSGTKTTRPSTHSRNSVAPEIAATQAEKILSQTHGSGRITEPLVKSEPFAYRPIPPPPEPVQQPSPPPFSIPSSLQQSLSQQTLSQNLAGLLNPNDPNAMNLLTICSMIDNKEISSAQDNPMVAAVIQDYLTRILSSQQTTQQPNASTSHQRAPSGDDEVVFLDKENVNPTDFRRRAEREREEAKLFATAGSSSSTPTQPSPRIGLSVRSNTMNDLPSLGSGMNASSTAGRKRTLSDADGPRRERQRKVSSSSKDVPSTSQRPALDPHRHYSRIAEPAIPAVSQSSPPRPSRDENMQTGSSRGKPIVIPDSPLRAPASSPVRNTQVKRKPYVVPEWARTTTATKPRFSEDASKALKEAQQRKEQERKAKRMRLSKSSSSTLLPTPPSSQPSTTPTPSTTPLSSSQSSTNPSSSQESSSFVAPTALPAPVAAASDLPIFAAGAFQSSIASSPPRSPSPNRSTSSLPFLPRTPKTPSRRAIRSGDDSPDALDGSLFTPLDKTPSARTSHSLLSPFLKSPSRHPKHVSFTAPGTEMIESSIASKSTANDEKVKEHHPHALPMASSDVEDNDEISEDIPEQSSSQQQQTDRNNEGNSNVSSPAPKQQYWQGLPPSSPPPPSSPTYSSPSLLTLSQEDEQDLVEDGQLPMISSDVEEDFTDTSEAAADYQYQLPESEADTTELDVFNLWMNNIQSDGTFGTDLLEDDVGVNIGGVGSVEGDQNGEEGLDLDEFLNNFIPLLGGGGVGGGSGGQISGTGPSGTPVNSSSNLDFDSHLGEPSLDGSKTQDTAQEMQRLLSGCVV
ncbi:hypothetical protein K435DRAFT_865352 [Dendrothele bispora CBS 962.96]|uniref:Ams2/SPT21 N-terminal domain-containing protein n=1 Tax=Dendrothele bispora (strain CBS 962.96) TaxID=1314807 RepID=A0A4S8LKE8_DENBC|nr:hypothetical protein K435DRAFT_865352 [Dendrothele bispora CBS 962.96]